MCCDDAVLVLISSLLYCTHNKKCDVSFIEGSARDTLLDIVQNVHVLIYAACHSIKYGGLFCSRRRANECASWE